MTKEKNNLLNKEKVHIKEIVTLQSKVAEQEHQICELQKGSSIIKAKQPSPEIMDPNASKIDILNTEFISNLEQVKVIGTGGNGRVVKVYKKVEYALKIMNVDDCNMENLKSYVKEYEILKLLNHPSILKVYGIFMGDESNPPAILLEICSLDISKALKKDSLSNVQIVLYIYQIADGMKYVHLKKIIHRDLKPSNILIGFDGNIRISDFGISKLMTDDEISMTTGVGTQKFMAPELINEIQFNEKVDVYSFGVLVYFILSKGQLPKITVTQIGNGKKAEIPSDFTDFASKLIDKCWNFDPDDRPSFKDICEEIARNKFNLLNLKNSERNEVVKRIKQYKSLTKT